MRATPIYDSIICFGDSLTQQASQKGGFVASLQDEYQRRLEVVSRGFSGYTSRQGIALCPTLFTPTTSKDDTHAKLAIVWFGTNDSVAPGYSQHVVKEVPIEEYKRNMSSILSHFTSTDVLLITPATVVFGKVENHLDDKSMVEYGGALVQLAQQVNSQRQSKGEAGKIAVVDMHAAFISAAQKRKEGVASLLIEDGLHINEAGYEVVFAAVREAISINFPHLHRDKLPFVFPAWSDLDLSADEQGQKNQLQPHHG